MCYDKKCKNLLTEKICDNCKHKEEDFTIHKTSEFPFDIPLFHQLLIVEKVRDKIVIPIKAFIKDDKVFILAEDFNKNYRYVLHFRYPLCLLRDKEAPEEYTCEQFEFVK